jgi:hypothetical protein
MFEQINLTEDEILDMRINAITPHIASRDWESAIALIELWSLSEQPEELTEGIDGRELLNAIREAFE